MCNAEKRARALIAAQSMPRLVEQFELTETVNDAHIPTVRGWLIDEMRARNEAAFDAWMDALDDNPDAGPRKFFL